MNRVLAMTAQQIMAPCRVYADDFPDGRPPDSKKRGNFLRGEARKEGASRLVSNDLKVRDKQAQATAKAAGKPHYESPHPCKKCGGTTRRTYDRRCAPCVNAAHRERERNRYVSRYGMPGPERRAIYEASEAARLAALANHEPHYIRAWPCKNCGGFLFYAAHRGGCVACIKKGSAARKRRERERKKAKQGG